MLFVVHWPEARIFAPDFHTDLAFAEAMIGCRGRLPIEAVAVGYDDDLSLLPRATPCRIPWETIEQEARDRGSYLLVLSLSRAKPLEVGSLGRLRLRRGHYVYVGSAMRALSKRIERHLRLRKRMHWHVDWLRQEADLVEALPIRASDRLGCDLAGAVRGIADWSVPGFGSSDCRCEGHLFGFRGDPRRGAAFQELLLRFRMERFGELSHKGRGQRALAATAPTIQRWGRSSGSFR